jgi:hypothetical protein
VGKITLFCLFLLVIAVVVLGLTMYDIDRDINGWKTRAQVSSEPNDMHEYMSRVQSGMKAYDMTHGYAALIFPTPDNDMALIYRAVGQHVEQAKILTTMDRSSQEYQSGLDNLRGSIRELDLHAYEYWSRHQGLAWNILFWVSLVLTILFGLAWSEMYI